MRTTLLAVVPLLFALTGCGGDSQADQVATRVAAGIAATQTMERQLATPVATAAPTTGSLPTAESSPVATATPPPPAVATATPPPPAVATATPPPPAVATATSTPAELVPLPTETASPTPPPVAGVFPIGGSTNGVAGAVLVPGYSQPPVPPDAFRDFVAFRVDARDPAVGQNDGAGIERVEFRVQQVDADGNQTDVYERTELNAPYCMFSGDDPACNPIALVQGATFPNGTPLVTGQYHVEIAIFGLNQEVNAFWNFDFVVELP
ncbi:MAG: hypothetical protein OHK0015_06530 [Chloroflexi bacterium OHK40]